jgi:hypothetical protein
MHKIKYYSIALNKQIPKVTPPLQDVIVLFFFLYAQREFKLDQKTLIHMKDLDTVRATHVPIGSYWPNKT